MSAAAKEKYFEGVGKRKEAIARVRLTSGKVTKVSVNGKDLKEYFPLSLHQTVALESLTKLKLSDKFHISARVAGGGVTAQAEAIRLGLARALLEADVEDKEGARLTLKKLGFLTRDARIKERRKFGLKKARKAPQWSKR